jgi:hypothetical protein
MIMSLYRDTKCVNGKVLEVDCKVRGASIRCGLEAGDGEAVLGGGGGTSFQYYQGKMPPMARCRA